MTSQAVHHTGESKPQNTADSFKFTLPIQTTGLELLTDCAANVWQFDEEVGLPVVAHGDYYMQMRMTYGEPDMREGGRTITLPIEFAEEREDKFPEVNFTRDDVLGFFAPEEKIANDFPRLYVGTFDDYKHLARGRPQIIWGESFERPAFAPSQQKHVREVCIAQPGEEPFRTTRPVSEGWVRAEKLLGQAPTAAHSGPAQRTVGDD